MFFTPSKLLVPSVVLVTVLASVQLTQAKSIRSLGYSNLRTSDAIKMRRGGCAAFGHSCFGGHGKRSDAVVNTAEGEDAPVALQANDDARSYPDSEGPRTGVEIFSRDQPDDFNLIPPQYQPEEYLRVPPLLRKWLTVSYRRGDSAAVNK